MPAVQVQVVVQVVMALIVVGVLLWLVDRFIPMASSIKSILNAAVVIGIASGFVCSFILSPASASASHKREG